MEKSCQVRQKGSNEKSLTLPACEAQTGVQEVNVEAQKVNVEAQEVNVEAQAVNVEAQAVNVEAQKVNVEAQAGGQIADKNQTGIVKPRRGRPKKGVDATVKMLVNIHQSGEQAAANQSGEQVCKQAKVQAANQAKVIARKAANEQSSNQAKVQARKAANEQAAGQMARVLDGKKASLVENADASGGDTNKLKDMIMQALDNAGGVAYLTDQALVNPNAFFGLVKSICTKSTASADTAVKGESIVIRIRGLKTK